MAYDPSELTPKDVIRGIAGDIAERELLQDETYLAVMARYGAGSGAGDPTDTAPFYRAAAEVVRRVATAIERQPTSISAPGDGSIGWGSSKSRSLLEKAKELDELADELEENEGSEIGKVVTVYTPYLTGGGEPWY